jgi:hypothetical protein
LREEIAADPNVPLMKLFYFFVRYHNAILVVVMMQDIESKLRRREEVQENTNTNREAITSKQRNQKHKTSTKINYH